MINPISAFSSTVYGTAAWQSRLDAARAAEQAGAQVAQEAVARQYASQIAQQPVLPLPDQSVGERQAKNLRSNGLFDNTELSDFSAENSSFRLDDLANRPAQTLADLRSPQLALDSAAFLNLFANTRPSLNLAVDNQTAVDAQSRPFQHATATLARIYGGAEELAVDIAA